MICFGAADSGQTGAGTPWVDLGAGRRATDVTAGSSFACALRDDGRVWACDLAGQKIVQLKAEKGAAIAALAMSKDGTRVAWGDEDGAAGVASV